MDTSQPSSVITHNIGSVKNLAMNGSTINVKKVTNKAPERKKIVSIFWDLQNCCVPKGKSVLHLVDKIRKKFILGSQEFEFRTFACVCDTKRESPVTMKDLNNGTVNVQHVDADAKNAADEKIKSLMDDFAKEAPTGSKIILISTDFDFSEKLSHLKNKYNYYVVLVHKRNVNPALLQHANELHVWEDITDDLPDIDGYIESTDDLLIVDGYKRSSNDDIKQLEKEINTLFHRYGGKVIKIGPVYAIVKLDDKNDIQRVKNELNGKQISGGIIKVDLFEESLHKQSVKKLINSHKPSVSYKKQKNADLQKQRSSHMNSDIVTDSVPLDSASTNFEVILNTPNTKCVKIGIFWDFETCPVEATQIKTVIQAIYQRYISKECQLLENICVCNVKQQEDDLLMKMAESHLTIVHSIKSSDETLRDSLQKFSFLCGPDDKAVIISSQPENLSLFRIKNHLHMDVVLIHSSSTPECFDFICTQNLFLSSLLQATD